MQERYLGDSHDYLKYALLRALHAAGFGPLGLAWYLTHERAVEAAGNADGEKRHHLSARGWAQLDPELHAALHAFAAPEDRSIEAFEASGILPAGTVFTARNPPVDPPARIQWWRAVQDDCAPARTVFSDPDNGFIVPSAPRRRQPKYATYGETLSLYRAGKTTVTIQFARQCDPVKRARDIRARLTETAPDCAGLPVLRGRTAPNILFIFLAPPPRHAALNEALRALVSRAPARLELIA